MFSHNSYTGIEAGNKHIDRQIRISENISAVISVKQKNMYNLTWDVRQGNQARSYWGDEG